VTVTKGWFDAGAGPDEVAYLAFTKAAAKEAAARIMDSELPKEWGDELPYFRTIHSLAYRGFLKTHKGLRVINDKDMKSFAQWSSYQGIYALTKWEDLSEVYMNLVGGGRDIGDDCLAAYTLSRITARTPEELEQAKCHMSDAAARNFGFADIAEPTYLSFVAKYESYKLANGLLDFTDMLAFALNEMPPLEGVQHLVVDEVQDNCPLLFSICDRLFPNAEKWLVGDPNQAIYIFSGADPKLFIDRARKADHRIVLRKTHRFGKEIVDFSREIINRAQDSILVDILGVEGRNHRIHMTGSFEPVVAPMMILHRHVLGCQAIAQAYIAAGRPFRNERGRDPLGAEQRILSFNTLRDLAEGRPVPSGAVSRLVDVLMPSILLPATTQNKAVRLVVHGAKKKLQEGLLKGETSLQDLIQAKILTDKGADVIRTRDYRTMKHSEDLEYYHRVEENGYSLEGKEIPTITTIHGSKGRQAPAVVVFNEASSRCFEDPDSEHRLAYVASTRTQGELQICAEKTLDWTPKQYDYPVPKEAPVDF